MQGANQTILTGVLFFSLVCSANATQSDTEADPWERYNRQLFKFNDAADRYVVKPIAEGYNAVTPNLVIKGITNFFGNLKQVENFGNSLLQAKWTNSASSLGRLVINTTFGVAGFVDVATSFDVVSDQEDFGQTLAVWGWENSNYLVLPLLGPSNSRDAIGKFVDGVFEPLHYFDAIHSDTVLVSKGISLINQRAGLLAAENLVIGDRYNFMRNAYIQNRDFLIHDGEVSDPFSDASFDNFEDF